MREKARHEGSACPPASTRLPVAGLRYWDGNLTVKNIGDKSQYLDGGGQKALDA